MIDQKLKTAALCLAWNIHNIANNARTNADFDDALWQALENFRLELEGMKRGESLRPFTVIDGGAA